MFARAETLLLVDDEPDFVAGTARILERAGYDVATATSLEECRDVLEERFVDLLLIDERLGPESGAGFLDELRKRHSGLVAVLVSGHADLKLALRAMRAGAIDLLPKPFSDTLLHETVRRALADSQLTREARYHRWQADREARSPEIVGNSPPMRQLMEMVALVAPTNSTVLIQGESGTGKELIARAIHAASPRRRQPMVSRNVAAMPLTLIESTLFGVRKGAFTDAKFDQPGLFEVAGGGILFLDEIGEAPLEVQVRLLRVLESRTVIRLGDTIERHIDVRLIVATNRDLKADVDAKRFRSDLYYRLNVVRIQIPPLRERLEDIEPLAKFLLAQQNKDQGKTIRGFDPAAIDKLHQYRWPGNVRELRNVVEFAVIHCQDDLIHAGNLHLDPSEESPAALDGVLDLPFREATAEFEQRYFDRLLQRTNGNKTKAADLAEIDRTVLHAHLRKLGGPIRE